MSASKDKSSKEAEERAMSQSGHYSNKQQAYVGAWLDCAAHLGAEEKELLLLFIAHLNESGVIKKGTALVDEVKYYLESKKP